MIEVVEAKFADGCSGSSPAIRHSGGGRQPDVAFRALNARRKDERANNRRVEERKSDARPRKNLRRRWNDLQFLDSATKPLQSTQNTNGHRLSSGH
jgi:hypothetical protein